ncbi:transposable element Tc3 transposase [Trichonephila clavipes]|nr:transposable element Tc3 transposase [Trichonephila clavipes]
MTGTLSYRPEETGGRQREKSLDTRHRRLNDRYRVLPWSEDCTAVVCLHDALYGVGERDRYERDRYGGPGVLVWGSIMLGSRTDLHIFDAGSVNGTRYCNEILLPYVRLFRGAMGLQFLFMDDNAPCHRTVATEQLLESEDIERMDWPARSPDLNPIEHVGAFLGRRLAARTLPPVTIRELRLALQDEWAAMPQQLIDTLILSMGRRCETCLAVSGEIISPTKDRMFLAGHSSQGCLGLQLHCAPCYFFNQASFYPSDFSFSLPNGNDLRHGPAWPRSSVAMGTSSCSQPKKIIIRIISTVEGYFRLYSTKNFEFWTICQLATCNDCRLDLPPYTIINIQPKNGSLSSRFVRFDEGALLVENGVDKQNSAALGEANPQVYVETPLHPRKKSSLWCALWAQWNPSSKTMKATTLQSMVIGIEP